MYAVIETGGKQYRVEVGTELEVELLDVEPGESLTIDRVLLVADGDETSVGQPVVANAAVEAEVLRRDRGDKVIVFKYRPKARRRVKKGHRQDHTVLRITDVKLGGRSAAEASRKAERQALTERQRLEEAAAKQAAADAELAAKLATQRAAETPKRGRTTKADKPDAANADAATAGDAAEAQTESRATNARTKDEPTADTADVAADTETTDTTTDADTPKRARTKKDE